MNHKLLALAAYAKARNQKPQQKYLEVEIRQFDDVTDNPDQYVIGYITKTDPAVIYEAEYDGIPILARVLEFHELSGYDATSIQTLHVTRDDGGEIWYGNFRMDEGNPVLIEGQSYYVFYEQ